MFVQEVSPISQLFSVEGATELNVDFGLPILLIKPGHPLGFMPVNCDIQFLQHTEVSAGW